MKNKDGHRKFGILDSISYAAGDIGSNMSFALRPTLIIFWTQFMGMSSQLYALLLVIVQVWAAITDPIIGAMVDADRRVHKRNKFLTYMLYGAMGLIVAGALCFLPFREASLPIKVIIFVVGYIIWDIFYTMANVPYGSLLSVISKDPADRASLSAWRSVGSMIGNMVPVAILPFLIYDSNENLIGKNAFIAALIMGVIGFFAFLFMIRTTVVRVTDQRTHERKEKFSIAKSFGNFIKNRPAVGATVAAMGMIIGVQASVAAVTVLFQSYFRNVGISGVVQVFSLLPVFIFTPFARKMVTQFGKKELSVVGALISIAASVAMLILPITPDGNGIVIYVICQLVNSLGIGIFSTVSWSLMGDAIDYNRWKTGAHEEGMVYSLHSFFRKLAQGFGPSLVLLVMAALGYVGANEGNQLPEVARNIRFLVPALYLFGAVLMLVGMAFIYNLDKKTLARMNKELDEHDK
ncbi:MAG: MFS transporter [Clostridia bacterium]|nr:MFS transporter [Clostridia bacterium]